MQGPNGKEGSDPLHLFPEGAGVRGLSSSLMESQPQRKSQGRQQMHTGSRNQQQSERGFCICSESGARLEVAFLRLREGLQGRTLKTSPVEDYSEQ